MTDRELLELAAKAAGLKNFRYCPEEDRLHECIEYDDEHDCTVVWMPHLDDGDALRLAVKLLILISPESGYTNAINDLGGGFVSMHSDHDGDAMAATRRAITRAAAEIQRAKEAA